jgi:hypothetical protein
MTQRYDVLDMLRATPRGVTSLDFTNAGILRAAARVKELRAEGYDIATVRDPDSPDGKRRFRFILRAEPEQREAPPRVDGALFEMAPGHVSRSAITGREMRAA